jgi:hypothetical protein
MSLTLTPDQQAQVDQEAVADADLPEYYSAALQTYIPISRDFEAFLILSTDNLKTTAINWIPQAATIQQRNKLRDALITLALKQGASNAQLQLNEYETQLQGFNEFRQYFITSSGYSNEFADVPEVQLFLSDLQEVMPEIIAGQARAIFDQTITKVIQTYQNTVGLTGPQTEELQSWTNVFSAYLS